MKHLRKKSQNIFINNKNAVLLANTFSDLLSGLDFTQKKRNFVA
jgi:hypothetical protein